MNPIVNFFGQSRRDTRKQRKAIHDALLIEPSTVSRIHDVTHLSKEMIVWHLLSMMKFSGIEVKGHSDDELVYCVRE